MGGQKNQSDSIVAHRTDTGVTWDSITALPHSENRPAKSASREKCMAREKSVTRTPRNSLPTPAHRRVDFRVGSLRCITCHAGAGPVTRDAAEMQRQPPHFRVGSPRCTTSIDARQSHPLPHRNSSLHNAHRRARKSDPLPRPTHSQRRPATSRHRSPPPRDLALLTPRPRRRGGGARTPPRAAARCARCPRPCGGRRRRRRRGGPRCAR